MQLVVIATLFVFILLFLVALTYSDDLTVWYNLEFLFR